MSVAIVHSCELASRRRFLSILACFGAVEAASSTLSSLGQIALAGERTLRDIAAQKGLLYGCATTQDFLSRDAEFARLLVQQCDILVPENALNWKYVEPHPGEFDFHLGDWMMSFAKDHNMKFGGGTLVWNQALPPWVSSITQAKARDIMLTHVRKIVTHYPKAFSWSVVNEATAFREARTELKDTPFLRLVGPDYIEASFKAAAEAHTGALLVYNNNHLEYDIPEDEYGRTTVLKLLKRFIANDAPIGALGIQSHLRTGGVPFSSGKLKDFLSRVADLGLKITVSELDVMEKGPETQRGDRDLAVAREIDRYLAVVLQEKAVISVVTWGLTARYTWLTNFAPRPDGQQVRPLPYDSDLHPTPAWQALANAFDRAPRR